MFFIPSNSCSYDLWEKRLLIVFIFMKLYVKTIWHITRFNHGFPCFVKFRSLEHRHKNRQVLVVSTRVEGQYFDIAWQAMVKLYYDMFTLRFRANEKVDVLWYVLWSIQSRYFTFYTQWCHDMGAFRHYWPFVGETTAGFPWKLESSADF